MSDAPEETASERRARRLREVHERLVPCDCDPGPHGHPHRDWCATRRPVGSVQAGTEPSEPALSVLAELVRLKEGPRDEEYERAKPLAWERARAIVTACLARSGYIAPEERAEKRSLPDALVELGARALAREEGNEYCFDPANDGDDPLEEMRVSYRQDAATVLAALFDACEVEHGYVVTGEWPESDEDEGGRWISFPKTREDAERHAVRNRGVVGDRWTLIFTTPAEVVPAVSGEDLA